MSGRSGHEQRRHFPLPLPRALIGRKGGPAPSQQGDLPPPIGGAQAKKKVSQNAIGMVSSFSVEGRGPAAMLWC